jgi:CSLREA domain-containing protein
MAMTNAGLGPWLLAWVLSGAALPETVAPPAATERVWLWRQEGGPPPRSLARGDFDGDGVVDLVLGFSRDDAGEFRLLRGRDVLADPAWWREGRAALLAGAPWPLPQAADLLEAGDFDADGRLDLLSGARGASSLQWLRGDGAGGFAPPATVELGGALAGLEVGEVGRPDGLADVLARVETPAGPAAQVFASGAGALRSPPREEAPPGPALARAADTENASTAFRLTPDAWPDRLVLRPEGLLAELTVPLLSFTVNSPADTDDGVCGAAPGGCTLREAIGAANLSAGLDAIAFDLGTGTPSIILTGALPAIAGPVVVDGATGGATRVEVNGNNLAINGIVLADTADGSTVRNLVVNRCGGSGMVAQLGSNGHVLEGNLVGTNAAGDADLGNGGHGIDLQGSLSHLVGGTTPSARNVISGNDQNGIQVTYVSASPLPTGIAIRGNTIGLSASGAADLGNSLYGVAVFDADGVTIGGTAPGAGNVISGNAGGVQVDGTTFSLAVGTTIQGNLIGTDATGAFDRGNDVNGLGMGFAQNMLVGGTTPAARNVISGNDNVGILLDWIDNVVQGNFIGLDAAGSAALPNGLGFGFGISASGQGHLIGGTVAGAGNVISGNAGTGVRLTGSFGANGITVQGNLIGTDPSGTADRGNTVDGVLLLSAFGELVGGLTPAARNVISGNDRFGLYLTAGGSSNTVVGNLIGTDATGSVAVPNGDDGLRVSAEPTGNTLGAPGAGNVVSGNLGDGVELHGNAGGGNFVLGNTVGAAAAGTAPLPNAGDGVRVVGGDHVLGGAGAGNVISGNGGAGLRLQGGASTVRGNRIGTRADGLTALGNGSHGIRLESFSISPSGNAIGGTGAGEGNVVAFNGGDGVSLATPAFGDIVNNPIRGNAIFANTGLGIDLGPDGVTFNDAGDADTGANRLQNFPFLVSVLTTGGATSVEGQLSSAASLTYTVEFFSQPACGDPTAFGEGQVFLSSAVVPVGASGSASFLVPLPAPVPVGQFLTATATDPDGNTSEFSRCRRVSSPTDDLIFADGFDLGSLS